MENNSIEKVNSLNKMLGWLGIPQKSQQIFIIRLAIFWILMTAIIVIDSNKLLTEISVDKPATTTIICPKNLSIIDKTETEKLREKSKEGAALVFVAKPSANELMLAEFDKNIAAFTTFYDRCKFGETGRNVKQLYKEMFPNGFFIDADAFEVICRYPASVADNLKSSARELLVSLCKREIYDGNIAELKKEVEKEATNAWTATSRKIFIRMIESVLTTNAYVDVNATNAAKEEAANNVKPVVKNYQKGQRIIAEGEIVTKEIFDIYNEVQHQLKKNVFMSMLGSMLLLFVAIVIGIAYVRLQDVNVFLDDVQYKLIGTLCFAFLLATKVVYGISVDVDKAYLLILLSPMASLTLLLTSTVSNTRIVYFIMFWMGLLSSVVTDGSHPYLVALTIGSIGGALSWEISFKENDVVMRNTIIGTGLNIGVATSLTILAFMMMNNEFVSVQGFYDILGYSLCGLVNGLISSVVANGVIPNLEIYFSFATPTRLLELTNTETPLLKRLQTEAPGTYAHSIAVADMAAKAASEVGADALLTRVCALYHDIGKTKRPEYFTENQHGVNPHDEKKPAMSTMIITSHVRDGVDIARANKIPHRVIEIMSQHHGTTLVEYFYNKQKALTPDVDETQFRYKGLKPQTKEAAILLLADAVEASSRSLDGELDSNRIKEHVKRIVEHKLEDDNQLEENQLSMGEISTIEDEFCKVLLAANHKRIKYQNQIKQESEEKAAEKAAAEKAEAEKAANVGEEKSDSAIDAASAEIAAKMAQNIEAANEAEKKSEDKVE